MIRSGVLFRGFLPWIFSALALVASPAFGATVEYLHTDALGSIVAVTNSAGQVIERREYEPYGRRLAPAPQDGPGYTGHVHDAVTGMVYMQQRYYDPGIGRFLSVDPVTATSVAENFNRYWYAANNPYKFTDPDGRMIHDQLRNWRDPQRSRRLFTSGCYVANACLGGPGDHMAAQAAKKSKAKSSAATGESKESAQEIYERASEEARRSGLPGAHNGPQDALRHCIGTCEMTRQYGSSVTFILGEANEKKGDWTHNQSMEEKAMDRHNNSVGDALGRRASSFRMCSAGCRSAVDSGTTVNGIASDTPYIEYEE